VKVDGVIAVGGRFEKTAAGHEIYLFLGGREMGKQC
jgi:hypothetical protein